LNDVGITESHLQEDKDLTKFVNDLLDQHEGFDARLPLSAPSATPWPTVSPPSPPPDLPPKTCLTRSVAGNVFQLKFRYMKYLNKLHILFLSLSLIKTISSLSLIS